MRTVFTQLDSMREELVAKLKQKFAEVRLRIWQNEAPMLDRSMMRLLFQKLELKMKHSPLLSRCRLRRQRHESAHLRGTSGTPSPDAEAASEDGSQAAVGFSGSASASTTPCRRSWTPRRSAWRRWRARRRRRAARRTMRGGLWPWRRATRRGPGPRRRRQAPRSRLSGSRSRSRGRRSLHSR